MPSTPVWQGTSRVTPQFELSGDDHDALGRINTITGPSASGGTRTSTYGFDLAARTISATDRLLAGANATGSYTYDQLGRQFSLPAIDTPRGETAGDLTVSYYDSDLARTVTQNGVTTIYDLDVMDRRSTSTTTNSSASSTTTRYCEDTSDNPAWATTATGDVTEMS